MVKKIQLIFNVLAMTATVVLIGCFMFASIEVTRIVALVGIPIWILQLTFTHFKS